MTLCARRPRSRCIREVASPQHTRSRPRPQRIPKDGLYPSPYDDFKGACDVWMTTRIDLEDSSALKASPQYPVIQIASSWHTHYPGCHTQRWEPSESFETRGASSGVISRKKTSLVVFGRKLNGQQEVAVHLPLLPTTTPGIRLRTNMLSSMKRDFAAMVIGDTLIENFREALAQTDLPDALKKEFTFNSHGTQILAPCSSSSKWGAIMVQPLVHRAPHTPELVISDARPKNDQAIPIYDNPCNEPVSSLPWVKASDVLYHHIIRAYAHFCFQHTLGKLILTNLRGEYTPGERVLVLDTPTVYTENARLGLRTEPSAFKAFRSEFVRHHECTWVCKGLRLEKLS